MIVTGQAINQKNKQSALICCLWNMSVAVEEYHKYFQTDAICSREMWHQAREGTKQSLLLFTLLLGFTSKVILDNTDLYVNKQKKNLHWSLTKQLWVFYYRNVFGNRNVFCFANIKYAIIVIRTAFLSLYCFYIIHNSAKNTTSSHGSFVMMCRCNACIETARIF